MLLSEQQNFLVKKKLNEKKLMTMFKAFTKFDPAEYLTTEEQIQSYLTVAKETNDPVIYENACEVAERSKKKLLSKNLEARVVLQDPKNDCGQRCL